jgi:cyclopropane fatty-acyl-phospholipid synthase-like methyltransferase
MLQHYVKELIPMISGKVSFFSEVGVGCGMYSQKTLEGIPHARGIGIDISDYALEFTYRIIKAHGFGDRYEIRNQDITKRIPEEKVDFVISQEVLEHLEDPITFIASLYKVVRPGGWGYITAAINAGHTDHIYLYRSSDEVRRQIEASGWKVCDVQTEESYPERPKELRPTIAGFLARKGM